MAERVYLHIGAAKTGTSYLQQMIWRNREVLEQQGVFLPGGSRRSQFDAVADLRGGMWSDRVLKATWDEVAAEVRETDGVALLSEELLCGSDPQQIERVLTSLAPVPVHVIHSARDIGRQIPAEWQQAVRARSPMSYDEYVAKLHEDPSRSFWNIQDPVAVFRRWGSQLEPAHFHLITVPPRGAPSSLLWDRYCAVIGADPQLAEIPESRQNESLGLVETELLRRFNGQLGELFPMRNDYIKVVRDHLMRPALLGAPGAVRIGVPEKWLPWIEERADQVVDELAALGDQVDVVGSLEDLRAHPEPVSLAPDDVTDAQLLESALAAWTRQLQAIEVDVDKRIAEKVKQRQDRIKAREQRAALEQRSWRNRARRRAGAVKRRVLRRS